MYLSFFCTRCPRSETDHGRVLNRGHLAVLVFGVQGNVRLPGCHIVLGIHLGIFYVEFLVQMLVGVMRGFAKLPGVISEVEVTLVQNQVPGQK